MNAPAGRLTLIANPRAGRGRVEALLPEIRKGLQAEGLDHELRMTSAPGDATGLAREAVRAGSRFLVAVGGDGTVHEVVNGMLSDDQPIAPDLVLGVVSAGSGCDFIRTFDLPAEPEGAVARLSGEGVRPLDVGKIGYVDGRGEPATRYFVNIAEAGLGGSTAARAAGLPRWLGQVRYLVAFWLTLPGFRPGTGRIEMDEEPAYTGRAVNVVMANCRFFGGGMEISPRSSPEDGALDVEIFVGPKTDSFTMVPKIYKGRHLPHRNIVETRGKRCTIDSTPPLVIEADGEVLGTSPVTVEILPGVVSLKA